MGLFITGNLLPQELTQKQWEQAYEEAIHSFSSQPLEHFRQIYGEALQNLYGDGCVLVVV